MGFCWSFFRAGDPRRSSWVWVRLTQLMCFVLCLHRYLQGYVWVCVFPVGRFTGTVRPGECWPRGQETATPEEDNDTLLSWSALSGGNYLGEWLSSLWRWIVVWETDCGNGRMSKHKETERQSGETDHHHWGRNCTGFRDTYSLGARPEDSSCVLFFAKSLAFGSCICNPDTYLLLWPS